jgi:hypothetical protein
MKKNPDYRMKPQLRSRNKEKLNLEGLQKKLPKTLRLSRTKILPEKMQKVPVKLQPPVIKIPSEIYCLELFPGLAFGDFKIHPAITPTARAPKSIKALETEIVQTRN